MYKKEYCIYVKPKDFWWDAYQAAVWIHNRTPTKTARGWMTLTSSFTGKLLTSRIFESGVVRLMFGDQEIRFERTGGIQHGRGTSWNTRKPHWDSKFLSQNCRLRWSVYTASSTK